MVRRCPGSRPRLRSPASPSARGAGPGVGDGDRARLGCGRVRHAADVLCSASTAQGGQLALLLGQPLLEPVEDVVHLSIR